jgi:hypothetical protein
MRTLKLDKERAPNLVNILNLDPFVENIVHTDVNLSGIRGCSRKSGSYGNDTFEPKLHWL